VKVNFADSWMKRHTGRFHFRSVNKYLPYILLSPAVAILLLLTIFPFIYSIYMSLHQWVHPPRFIGLGNFSRVIMDDTFLVAVKNTAIFTTTAIIIEIILGGIIALILDRKIPGINVFRFLFLLPVVIAPFIGGVMWRLMYGPHGIVMYIQKLLGFEPKSLLASSITALPAVIVVDIWQWTPFVAMILLAGLGSIPKDLYEAACVDGSTNWQILTHIKIPLLKPIIIITIIFRLFDCFRIFDPIMALTQGGPGLATETLSTYIYRIAFKWYEFGYGAALSFFMFSGTLILSLILLGQLSKKMR